MEFMGGNKSYEKYFSHLELKTSILNLMELYYHILRDAGEERADESFMQFKQFEASLSNEDVKEGMKFRLRSKARRLDFSYSDAVGYVMAERLGSKFLTGDKAFEGLSNVEFVK